MLDMQRYITATFRLAAIIILLPQAREIRHGLRPCRDRHRREQEHAQADSHRAIYQLLAVSHSQLMLNPRGSYICRRYVDLLANLRMQTAEQTESHAGFPNRLGSQVLWCSLSG